MSNNSNDVQVFEGDSNNEEYVMEEVTDDEVDDSFLPGEPTSTVAANEVPLNKPVEVGHNATPGPATANKTVFDMLAKNPNASSSRAGPPAKAPVQSPMSAAKATKHQGGRTISLATTGSWIPQDFSKVTVVFPALSNANETTNELTRSNRPENRYWRGDIKFILDNERSNTIRVFNVPVPYIESPNYGVNFVYMCLPGWMGKVFGDAGKTKRPTIQDEPSLVHDENRWWKIANNVTDKFGVGNSTTKTFKPTNIQTVFASSTKGVVVNVELKFSAKVSTDNLAKLTSTNPQKITVDLVRAYIMQTDVDVEPPTRKAKVKNSIAPGATSDDFASDDVMKRLAAMGL